MHYYQHHIGDFIKETARLTDSQGMAYLHLIWMYYDSEKPLRNDVEALAFQIGAQVADVELLLRCFFNLQDDGWHNEKCDAQIAEYHAYAAKKAEAGRASAEKRKGRDQKQESTPVEQVLNGCSTGVEQVLNECSTVVQPNHITNKPINQSQDLHLESREKPKRFSPPTLNELSDYFFSKGETDFEAKRFFDYYTSNNWRVGKNKMACWKSAVNGWIARKQENAAKPQGYLTAREKSAARNAEIFDIDKAIVF